MSWSTRFEDPITLPDGHVIETYREAAEFIQSLPKAKHRTEPWQLAGRILIEAAEGRDFSMHARIAFLRALQRPQ